MSNTASNFLTTPFPQEEEIYGTGTPVTNVTGEIRSGFTATVVVSQVVKAEIGSTAIATSKLSQSVKGEIGTPIRGQANVTLQKTIGEIGSSVRGATSTGGHVVTTGSLHTSIIPSVVVSVSVRGSIGARLSETSITSDIVEGSIGSSLTGKAIQTISVTGSIGISIKERHYTPMNKNITVKVL